jgi:hypothetical protein
MNVVANMQAEKNRQIMHSIDYASVIQRALLRPSDAALRAALPDAHLEWQPRDVVGGDFYFSSATRAAGSPPSPTARATACPAPS